ncbi:hypothetical protein [Mycoplasmopsis verecunda]|uniref:DNA polymerase-3 subunit delta n=1 Tax=Mycoplasmopsis verecunda TaxID=171291 RepID=A0A1T4L0J6_9BACT|nr:hypothetical protein [Mycoplasmopsis verecunda]WPB54400.1 hypothetical protein SAM46_02835 [Mycoplasmopsis verecunda]SJZ48225.1 DNA polymerase-3 subunit delta' [Mycoplasmopsis verecunda]
MLNSKKIKNINELAKINKLSHLFLLQGEQHYNFDNDLISLINVINDSNDVTSLECLTPNVTIISGESESIKKDDLENAFYSLSFSSTTNDLYKYSLLIIKNIDNCSINGLNAILKSIEEPSEGLIIILTTNNINAVLETIISRAQVIKVDNRSTDEIYSALEQKIKDINVSILLADIFKSEGIFQEFETVEKYQIETNFLINAITSSLKKPEELFIYLDTRIKKDDSELSYFILTLIKNVLLGKIDSLQPQNNLTNLLIKIRGEWVKKAPKIISFVLDIDKFIYCTSKQMIYELQKQLMLNKLLEYYG